VEGVSGHLDALPLAPAVPNQLFQERPVAATKIQDARSTRHHLGNDPKIKTH
jgi:hypothetical protein